MILDRGASEPLKAAVHGGTCLLLAVCTGYNFAAFVRRRERHLIGNALVYAALTAFEGLQTVHHLAEPDA